MAKDRTRVRQTALDALAERFRARDPEAYVAVYDATAGMVFGLALQVTRNWALAEEVVQDVYLQAWVTAERYDPKQGTLSTWLNMITHRRAVDKVRQTVRAGDRELRLAGDRSRQTTPVGAGAQVEVAEDVRRVELALEALPEAQRTALTMAYFEGYTQAQIAELLGIPLGTVKTRVRDGLGRLRLLIGER